MEPKPILLVEDNPDDVDLTLMALKRSRVGNKIVVAKDGAEALDYLFCRGDHDGRPASEDPAMILLDLNLPRVGGLEVLRQLREAEATKRIPVVILTTSDEESDVVRGYDLGVNSYVRKPVDFNQFAKLVEDLGYYWIVVNLSAD